jgi:hypothetical protein
MAGAFEIDQRLMARRAIRAGASESNNSEGEIGDLTSLLVHFCMEMNSRG